MHYHDTLHRSTQLHKLQLQWYISADRYSVAEFGFEPLSDVRVFAKLCTTVKSKPSLMAICNAFVFGNSFEDTQRAATANEGRNMKPVRTII